MTELKEKFKKWLTEQILVMYLLGEGGQMTALSKKVKDKMLRSRLATWVITGNDLCYMEDKPVPEWTKNLKTRIMEALIIYGDKIKKEGK